MYFSSLKNGLTKTTDVLARTARSLNQNATLINWKDSAVIAASAATKNTQQFGVLIANTTSTTLSNANNAINQMKKAFEDSSSDESESEIENKSEIEKPKTEDEKLIKAYNEFVVKMSEDLNDGENIALPSIDIYRDNPDYCEKYATEIKEHLYHFEDLSKLPDHLSNIDKYIKSQEELEQYKKECEENDEKKTKDENNNIEINYVEQSKENDQPKVSQKNNKNFSMWSLRSMLEKHLPDNSLNDQDGKTHKSVNSISSISTNCSSKKQKKRGSQTTLYVKTYIEANTQNKEDNQSSSKSTINSNTNHKIDSGLLEDLSRSVENFGRNLNGSDNRSNSIQQSTQSLAHHNESPSSSLKKSKSGDIIKSTKSSHFSQFFKKSKNDINNPSVSVDKLPEESETINSQEQIQRSESSTTLVKSSSEETIVSCKSKKLAKSSSKESSHEDGKSTNSMSYFNSLTDFTPINEKKIEQKKKPSRTMRVLSFFACGSCKSKKSHLA